MSKKLTYERYHWFHNEVKKGNYPNASKLANKFEISEKTGAEGYRIHKR